MSRKKIKGKPYNCIHGCRTWEECDNRNRTDDDKLHGVLNAAKSNIFYCNCVCWEWLEHVMLTELCKFEPRNKRQ